MYLNERQRRVWFRLLESIQWMEELGGPEPEDYIALMTCLAEECNNRAKTCSQNNPVEPPPEAAQAEPLRPDEE